VGVNTVSQRWVSSFLGLVAGCPGADTSTIEGFKQKIGQMLLADLHLSGRDRANIAMAVVEAARQVVEQKDSSGTLYPAYVELLRLRNRPRDERIGSSSFVPDDDKLQEKEKRRKEARRHNPRKQVRKAPGTPRTDIE
jgi:hypothetical protein